MVRHRGRAHTGKGQARWAWWTNGEGWPLPWPYDSEFRVPNSALPLGSLPVLHPHQRQPARGGRGAGGAAVAGGEDLLELLRGHAAVADLQQRAHDGADHVVEETVRRHHVAQLVAGLDQLAAGDAADVVLLLVELAGKAAEVVFAGDEVGAAAHGVQVQRAPVPQDEAFPQRTARAAEQDAVAVELAGRVEAGVEVGGSAAAAQHRCVGRQVEVEGGHEALRRQRGGGVEVRHLRLGVEARVRAAGARDAHGLLRDAPDGLLQRALHGPPLRLKLPAEEVGAVVFECKSKAQRRCSLLVVRCW